MRSCMGDALFEGKQVLAERGLADVADDAGGDFMIGLVAPGALQPGFGISTGLPVFLSMGRYAIDGC